MILGCSLVSVLAALSVSSVKPENETKLTPVTATISSTTVSGQVEDLELLAASDPVSAINSLSLSADGSRVDCHTTAHKIGAASYTGGVLSLEEIVSKGVSLCLGGVMHGAMEEFARKADITEFEAKVGEVCSMVPESYSGSCTHGAGHAIAVRIPEDHRAAVQLCSSFKEEMLSSNCAAGVLMAYIDDRGEGSTHKALRGKPSAVCGVFEGTYARECWRKALKLMEGSDVQLVFEECKAAPDTGDCDRHVGVRLVSDNARPDIQPAFEMADTECSKASSVEKCRRGAVWSAANESSARGSTKENYKSLCTKPDAVNGCTDEEKSVFFG
jgi:hypothetical protein